MKAWIAFLLASVSVPTIAPAADPPAPAVQFVVGNAVWQPGQRYRSSPAWLALKCIGTGCRFEPARLVVRTTSWQGQYDDAPTAGQTLTFHPAKPGNGKVVAWFRANAAVPWLAPGPVTTYASTATRVARPASEGTLEVAVDLPDGVRATLVPLLDRANGSFHLQLRMPEQRQLLGPLGACSGRVSTDYFLWAGDLDRDGRPDFLISFVDADGQVVLYLSGAARVPEIAGTAGAFDAPPFGGECDGGGWAPP